MRLGERPPGGEVDAQEQPLEQVEELHVYHLGPYATVYQVLDEIDLI